MVSQNASTWAKGSPLCLKKSLIDLGSWGEEKAGGTFVKLLLQSFLGVGQGAWATLHGSWGQWSFKPATFSYVNKPCLPTQSFCPMKTGWVFHPSSKTFVYPERRTKEFEEPTGATHPSVNIPQCMVHVLAHVMAWWCSLCVFWLHWAWNAYCHILRPIEMPKELNFSGCSCWIQW